MINSNWFWVPSVCQALPSDSWTETMSYILHAREIAEKKTHQTKFPLNVITRQNDKYISTNWTPRYGKEFIQINLSQGFSKSTFKLTLLS